MAAEPSTLKRRRFGNILVIGSAAALPVIDFAQRAGSSPYPYRVIAGSRLAQLSDDLTGFTDTDAQPSPPPERLVRFGNQI